MAVKIGHASISENRNAGWDGKAKAGDQTGKEVCIRDWYPNSWHTILRAKNPIVAQAMAKICEDGCKNNHIGYDQSQRNTAYTEAKRVNYDLSRIITNCETDCSAFMTLCAICAGITELEYKGNAPTTSNMVMMFSKTGKFEVITGSGITNSDKYLKRGDILVKNGHTAMVLTDSVKQKNERPLIKLGSSGEHVIYLHSRLQAFGYGVKTTNSKFDELTDRCVRHFQATHTDINGNKLLVDGEVGSKTWSALGI